MPPDPLTPYGNRPMVTPIVNAVNYHQKPLKHGAHLVVHSATKALGGHNDIMAGAIAGLKRYYNELWFSRQAIGAGRLRTISSGRIQTSPASCRLASGKLPVDVASGQPTAGRLPNLGLVPGPVPSLVRVPGPVPSLGLVLGLVPVATVDLVPNLDYVPCPDRPARQPFAVNQHFLQPMQDGNPHRAGRPWSRRK